MEPPTSRQGQANLCAFEDIVSLTRRFVPQNSAVVERAEAGELGMAMGWENHCSADFFMI
jgi:hypothetical protein